MDESVGSSYVVVGCICCPIDKIAELEKQFHLMRLNFKCWGELDWSGLEEEYLEKYKQFTNIYFKEKDITFHSWAYRKPTAQELKKFFNGDEDSVMHKYEFLLLKNTLRRCVNAGIKNFYVIVDKLSGGFKQYMKTKKLLEQTASIRPSPNIIYFNPVDSRISSIMQISSLCTSAVRHTYEFDANQVNARLLDDYVRYLEKLNDNISLKFSPRIFPKLTDYKFHHISWKPLLSPK